MPQLPAPAVDTEDATSARARIQARVDAAAFARLREGKNPTVSLVRARMGGGSPNLVAPALQRWRLTFAAQLDDNAGSALEVLPPGVLELLQALWSRALFEAHRVRADAPSSSDALDQLRSAIRELYDLTARLQAREMDLDARERRITAAETTLARRSGARPKTRRTTRALRMPTKKRKTQRVVQRSRVRKLPPQRTKIARTVLRGRVKSKRR